ncbi:MAG: amidohydrolase [Chloroflexi bacterium]|nr:amidohydrolase [Chloroflexota bacterium]
MKNGFKVIDGDGHMQEPMDIWENYTEAAFIERIPKVSGHTGRSSFNYAPCEIFPEGRETMFVEETYADVEERYGEAYRSWWSLPSRLQHMDEEGVDVQVCFPTNGALATSNSVKDVHLQAALVRAYNDWAIDFCHGSSGRVLFVAQASPSDADEAMREVERIASNPAVAAVTLAGFIDLAKGQKWCDEKFDGVWQLLESQGLPAAFHGGGSQHSLFSQYQGEMKVVAHAISFPVDLMLSLADLIFGNVLERFPDLRCGFYEANAGWVPYWLARLDDHGTGRQARFMQGGSVSLKPSEYFLRQCSVSCDADEGTLPLAVDYLEGGNIIFNTDYPHPDAPFPGAVDKFLEQPIPEEAKRKILWDNSMDLYRDRITFGR